MDPYLEGPLWTTVHANLVEEIARQLAPKLRPKYLALTNQRVTVTTPDPIELAPTRSRLPGVGVYDTGTPNTGSGAAVLSAPLTVDALMPEPITQTFIEIRDTESRTLVTAIEVLSPTNKRGDGLEEYRKKRQELLGGTAHLLEIDLLRIGERFPVASTLPSVPYFVFLSRANRRPKVETWPIALDQTLPQVPVPLLAGDDDVFLDLQLALNTVYDLFAYDQAANHSGNAPVPLAPDQLAFAENRLKQAGMRS
jgi:hypothetical protein